jgi:hypothetical protein
MKTGSVCRCALNTTDADSYADSNGRWVRAHAHHMDERPHWDSAGQP